MIEENTVTLLIIGLQTLTLVLGGFITYLAWKAYRRTDERSLGSLSVGFAIITVGALLAGVVDQLLGMDLAVAMLVQSALIPAGFLVIVYSLYMTAN